MSKLFIFFKLFNYENCDFDNEKLGIFFEEVDYWFSGFEDEIVDSFDEIWENLCYFFFKNLEVIFDFCGDWFKIFCKGVNNYFDCCFYC